MSAIMKLTKHGAIIPTHTPYLVIANMVDMEWVQNCISAWKTIAYCYRLSQLLISHDFAVYLFLVCTLVTNLCQIIEKYSECLLHS